MGFGVWGLRFWVSGFGLGVEPELALARARVLARARTVAGFKS